MQTERIPQGDRRLIDDPVAVGLLASTELARLAYTGRDGAPRVLPMLFHWTGDELVFSTFAGAAKIAAIRARPQIAVTIDRAGPPPEVLLLRGRAQLVEVDGLLEEYIAAHRRYGGEAQVRAVRAESDRPGVRMARIGLVPDWVGVLDFTTRFPGGSGAEAFASRGT